MSIKKFFFNLFHWEKWHYHVKYIPLYPAWMWYCLRSGSWWFFTSSNPTLTFGGFEGESKKEMYDQLPTWSYPKSVYISPFEHFTSIEKKIADKNFAYPIAVKPDIGMMGFLFRKIDNLEDLINYHSKIPVDYIIQELIAYRMEVSVFYYRFPGEENGHITGFLKKELLEVTGDGKQTLGELMVTLNSRPSFKINEWKIKHATMIHQVIPAGEVFRISWVANLSRGGKLIHLADQKDEALLKVFDELSHYTKHFYYGRYDIKCESIEELKMGNFSILEFNGSGAEPHHIYGSGNYLLQAYKIILDHWAVLYRISRYNHDKGIRYWKFRSGLKFLKEAKKHFSLLKKLDQEI
ncbi:MAG: hypothetical protein ABJA57_08630 [Ginsengibacter sp.]